MRTLTLELLRHGPAHNQLLSPLTPYLALCENHPAVTLQLPMEHNQLLHRLGAALLDVQRRRRAAGPPSLRSVPAHGPGRRTYLRKG